MKIEKINSYLARDQFIVEIITDKGISGVGQSACWAYPEAVKAIVDRFKNILIGKDPFMIEEINQLLMRTGPFRGSVLSGAISCIDIALWDIKGKYFETPIWNLLGGKVRNKVRLHLLLGIIYGNSKSKNEGLYESAKKAVKDGFTALKIDPLPDNYYDLSLDQLIKETIATVAALREGAGSEVDIILEIHRKLTPMTSVHLAEAIKEFNPMFFEDPIQIDSIISQSDIAKKVSIPIANGERMHSIWEFRELLANGGPQYVRPDVGLAGGITQTKKIASIAESYHSALITHNFLGPILTAASVHIDVSIPNFITQEYSLGDESEKNNYLISSLKREGGYIITPEKPGLGIEINKEIINQVPYEPLDLNDQVPYRLDGSNAFSV
ncbi:MAG: mandelate racemase/muconate lactonizing enzyme family protein [Chloroflexota bacterium]|nr:mandelate racemase/muconate lactonizing enzyme family protein [Chloroflexota bacterium]|tara:strand:+ start:1323 stop:2471 length:1149 start_codon:yes stop_codon:yes gene_type:complete